VLAHWNVSRQRDLHVRSVDPDVLNTAKPLNGPRPSNPVISEQNTA